MPVLGAVVTLRPAAPIPPELTADPRITLGERLGDRLPCVIVTAQRREDRELLERLQDLPQVTAVQVAFVEFSDLVEVSP